ncbi:MULTISPECIES: RagB/SusD family nutrient uptake outer membrane protein [Odoribacteraceae]|uniref:RagB/SusD family nutrient uptake outer membrane protein n=1 Tax=Odoribacteraceae TaxID=1853231 RepID=UPI0013142B8C|nr:MULTISPECIES: RagB/SusD family nutrient uptake outer membrane protein [Odoribacteraceae]MCQ4872891.1 RagB/SusD family nutrient uptake outer membrane protein [Butyricimonas paravirosa]
MKNKIFILGAIAGSFMLGSCGSFLEEESQSEVIPKTTSDFSELLLGTGYPDESAPNISFISLMDDDCAHFLTYASPWDPEGTVGTSNAITQFPIYSWQSTLADYDGYNSAINETASSTVYAQFYSKILGCNAVLDYIDEAIGTQDDRDRVKAEALAVRALLYFQLVNIYGEPYNHNKEALGVPVRLIADLTEKQIERSTVGYVYEEVILKDLLEAARLMESLPVMRKNYRINQPAIHILLSRVYLYMEDYKACIAEVEKAEKQGIELLNMVNNLDAILTENGYAPISYNNPEVEWFFGPSAVANHWEYQPGTAPAFRVLWDQVNDQRFLAYGLEVVDEANTVYLRKPMGGLQLGQSIRSAEAFLNRMEAYALSGEEGLALAELNAFRKARIIGYTDVSLSGQTLLDEIRLERRKELCFEGHRWFDLRRQGMPEIKHTYKAEKGGAVYEYVLKQGDPMYTIPFPNSVVLQNRALVQNSSREMGERQGEIK